MVCEFEPRMQLAAVSAKPTWDFLSIFAPPLLLSLSLSLSLSLKNKVNIKKEKKIESA